MSRSQRRRNEFRGSGDKAHEQLLQERLQILLQRLGWSYTALWTLNPQTRVLEWKRGHFQMDIRAGTTRSQQKVWNAQQFCTTCRSCSFAPGAGFVGRAYLEGRQIWLSGDLVCQNAGSRLHSQFLRDAIIKTVMCIPWLDSILELGTTNLVGEDFELMDGIQQVMSHDLLSVLSDDDAEISGFVGHDQAVTNSSPVLFNGQSPTDWAPVQPFAAAMSTLPVPEEALNRSRFQSAFADNLSDHVWRSDMFMQEQGTEHPDIAAAWSLAIKDDGHQSSGLIAEQSTSHGLMNSQADTGQYGTCSDSFGSSTAATTSSNRSSLQGDDNNHSSSPAAASPDQLHGQRYHLPGPVSGSSVPDRTSSSGRLPHSPHLEAEVAYPRPSNNNSGARATLNHQNLRRTTSCSDQYEIQKALSFFEAQETQSDKWRQLQAAAGDLQNNPASTSNLQQQQGFSFPTSWQQDQVQDPSLVNNTNFMRSNLNSTSRMKQGSRFPLPLLRRHTLSAMEVLKEVDTYHQDQAADQAASNFKFFGQPAHVEMNTPKFRGRARMSSCHGSGVLHGNHTEAAVNHMLAERQRRLKQKENFATLRRLVPIISKADKASTLVDAIAYLKDLQNTIVHMEANKEDMDQRCENLAHKCMELEEKNKELVAILSRGKLDSTVPLNHPKLQSMKSTDI